MPHTEHLDAGAAWRTHEHLRISPVTETTRPVGAWARGLAFIAILAGGVLATLILSTSVLAATATATVASIAGCILLSLTR